MLSQSPYEAWVRRLRAWGKDPTTSLADLPAIASDEFSPDSFSRLIDHIMKANKAFMDLFSERLQKVFEEGDPQLFARGYHNLQYFYAHRFELARHPGLPKEISAELEKAARADLESIQAEVEQIVVSHSSRSVAVQNDDTLRIVRENSLKQLLRMDAPLTPDDSGSIKAKVNLIPTYDPNAR
jgi:hypothetical protein